MSRTLLMFVLCYWASLQNLGLLFTQAASRLPTPRPVVGPGENRAPSSRNPAVASPPLRRHCLNSAATHKPRDPHSLPPPWMSLLPREELGKTCFGRQDKEDRLLNVVVQSPVHPLYSLQDGLCQPHVWSCPGLGSAHSGSIKPAPSFSRTPTTTTLFQPACCCARSTHIAT